MALLMTECGPLGPEVSGSIPVAGILVKMCVSSSSQPEWDHD